MKSLTLNQLEDLAIYNLMSEKEILRHERLEEKALNEGSADLEDLELLEKQARDYFRKPLCYPISEESLKPMARVFIYLFNGFKDNGEPFFRSTNESFEVLIDEVFSVDSIASKLQCFGYELSDLIQVRIYSAYLANDLGAISYNKGESKALVEHSQEFPNVLYAIPSEVEAVRVIGDDSIYSALNRVVSESIGLGRHPSEVLGKSYDHYEMTNFFYENVAPEISYESPSETKAKIIELAENSRDKFQNNFKEEVDLIKKLNAREISASFFGEEASLHLVNRVLWVARNKQFKLRIESKGTFLYLVALSKKLSLLDQSKSNKAA